MNFSLPLFAALTLLAATAQAGIEFESTRVTVPAKLEDEMVEFFFKFKITGENPVRITKMDVSCGCLEASLPKSEFLSGETGAVKIVMKIGSIEGESYKATTITTNDPAHESIQLDAIVQVPRLYEVTPTMATWQLNDPPTAKTLRLKILGKDPINILKYISSRENMNAELKEIEAGRTYDLILTPKTTELPELGIVTLETDCKIPKYTKRQVFFTIVRPKSPPKPAAHP